MIGDVVVINVFNYIVMQGEKGIIVIVDVLFIDGEIIVYYNYQKYI